MYIRHVYLIFVQIKAMGTERSNWTIEEKIKHLCLLLIELHCSSKSYGIIVNQLRGLVQVHVNPNNLGCA